MVAPRGRISDSFYYLVSAFRSQPARRMDMVVLYWLFNYISTSLLSLSSSAQFPTAGVVFALAETWIIRIGSRNVTSFFPARGHWKWSYCSPSEIDQDILWPPHTSSGLSVVTITRWQPPEDDPPVRYAIWSSGPKVWSTATTPALSIPFLRSTIIVS